MNAESPRVLYHLRRAARLALHLKRASDDRELARLRLAITHHKAKAKSLATPRSPVPL